MGKPKNFFNERAGYVCPFIKKVFLKQTRTLMGSGKNKLDGESDMLNEECPNDVQY